MTRAVKRLLPTLAILIAGCGGHAGASARHAGPEPTAAAQLVVVGDSLAAGRFADTQDEAFPQQLAAAIRAEPQLLGVPGATTAQLGAQEVPGGGKVVVVEAGTNDFLYQTSRR